MLAGVSALCAEPAAGAAALAPPRLHGPMAELGAGGLGRSHRVL